MEKRTKGILVGAGAVVAGAGAVTALSLTVIKKLVGMAMDRPEPEMYARKKEKLTGDKNYSELREKMAEIQSRLENNSGIETVKIESRDGLTLVGHWHTCEAPKRIIVAMHGWRSGWAKDFGVISDFWHENDCCVLYAEQRAQGDSEGEYMSFGLMERYDCLDWVNWVNEQTGGQLPVYLAGVSMGATTVLMAAGLDLPDNVKGIAADCGFTSAHAIWKHVVSDNLHIPYSGINAAYADKLYKDRTEAGTKDCTTIEAMERCPVPVLFIHGEDDPFVPMEMTYENYEACRSPKRLFTVPGARHGMSYLVDKEGYEREMKAFWSQAERQSTDTSADPT